MTAANSSTYINENSATAVENASAPQTIDHLNSLLRGEISAAETYRMAIDKHSERSEDVGLLQQIQAEHGRAAQAIRDRIHELGGEASDASGAWGIWSKVVQAAAGFLGNVSGLKSLKEGEEHGLKEYVAAIEEIDPTSRQLIQNQIIPAQQRHAELLDQMIAAAQNASKPTT
jgi:bacterioferritin (cytochrome b1)